MGVAGMGFLAGCLNSGLTGFAFAPVSQPYDFPTAEIKMNERTCSLWARASMRVWPEKSVLVSLPTSSLSEAANIVGRTGGAFAALLLERDEVSLTLPEHVWSAHAIKANAQDGPYRAACACSREGLGSNNFNCWKPNQRLSGRAPEEMISKRLFHVG